MRRTQNRLITVRAMAGYLACIMLVVGVPSLAADVPVTKTISRDLRTGVPLTPRPPSSAPPAPSPTYTPSPPAQSPPVQPTTAVLAPVAPTLQTCKGPERNIAPKEIFNLTCNVVIALGISKMLVLPETWTPGNGCIVTVDKPRVVMVGNNYGVSATFTNRCAWTYRGSEGGLGWLVYQIQ